MNYKMLALDLDGTLLQDDLTILPEVLVAITKLMSRGIIVTLSTGRAFPSAKKYADIVGITAPLVCYNGAEIRNADGGEPIYFEPLSGELVSEIIAICEKNDWYVQLYNDDKIIVSEITEDATEDPDYKNCGAKAIGKLSEADLQLTPKMMLRAEHEEIPYRTSIMKEALGDRVYISGSTSRLIEIMHKGVNKSNSLGILCERLGIAPEELIACGDGDNDEPMLRYAGLGCAMSNATEKTKAAADYICKNANGHGVLEVIKNFLKAR